MPHECPSTIARSNSELCEGILEQPGVGVRCPEPAGSRAVTVARAVDHNDPIAGCQPIDEAADREVLDHSAIAMDQDYGIPFPALDVVQSNPIHFEEAAKGRIYALCPPALLAIVQGGCRPGRS